MAFTPSLQQQAYFDWIDNGHGSAIVEAVAGAGKTTTLIEGLRRMEGSIYFGAFGKEIAKEIKAKAEEKEVTRKGLLIGTMHSAGLSAWRRQYPNVRIEGDKVKEIVDNKMLSGDVYEFERNFIIKTVGIAKQLLLPLSGESMKAQWLDAVEHYSLEEDLPEDCDVMTVMPKVIDVYLESRKLCPNTVDFADMIYAPLSFRARFWQNDWVLIDEAQDTNPARRMLARAMLKRTGRLVAVGDPRQAIFGFTGASANALDLIRDEHHCVTIPLTVTYRCPKAVVNYVHRWVSHIEAHPSAPEGMVRPAIVEAGKAWYITDKPGSDDMVLCRFTKPLIDTAYGMLRAGHACKVEGRDIGNGLKNLAKRWKVKSIDALEGKLEAYLAREVKKARAKKSETAEQVAIDKVATLHIFIARCREKGSTTVACVVEEIDSLFADDVKGVTTLMTIHKAKGRERGTVYWIQGSVTRELKPHEAVQEDNLCYVAGTRAMNTLVLVPEQPK